MMKKCIGKGFVFGLFKMKEERVKKNYQLGAAALKAQKKECIKYCKEATEQIETIQQKIKKAKEEKEKEIKICLKTIREENQ